MNSRKKLIGTLSLCTLLLLTTTSVIRADDSTGSSGGVASSSGVWSPDLGHFTYADGSVVGTNCHFTIDPDTGTITDYTVRLTRYFETFNPPVPVLPPDKGNDTITHPTPSNITESSTPEQAPEIINATIFSSVAIDDFSAVGEPAAYANFFTVHGTDALMMFYDYEGGNANYYAGAHSIHVTFTVPQGTNITPEMDSYSVPNEKGVDYQSTPGGLSWHSIQLTTDDVVTSITITNGEISTTGQMIKVTLEPYGSLSSYSWVQYPAPKVVDDYWYNDLNISKDKTVIENAKDTGVIPAEGWCTGLVTNNSRLNNGKESTVPTVAPITNSNYYRYNDPSFNMSFNTIDKNNVDVVVNSEIPTGRIVIINLQRNVLNATSISDLLVSIDSAGVSSVASLEDLMTKVEAKDTTGAYYALMGEHLVSVFVYIPHFSTHTISIKSLVSPIPALTSGAAPIVLSVAFLAAIVVGLILQRRKPYE